MTHPETGRGGAPAAAAGFGWRLALLVLLAALAWSGAVVRAGAPFDDREILESPYVEGALPWSAALRQDYWHHRGDAGHWRPAALIALRADRALWGDRLAGYHATNVLLHVGVVVLAALFLRRRAARGGTIAWLGLGLFALHPALADAVAWISGRTSMLAALGGLAGALGIAGARRAPAAGLAAALGLGLGLAGKEDAVAFVPLYLALALAGDRTPGTSERTRRVLAVVVGTLAALAVVGALRWAALGSALPYAPHAPLAEVALTDRILIGGRAALEGLRLAVLPIGYPPHYGGVAWTREVPAALLPGLLGLGALAAAAALALTALVRTARSHRDPVRPGPVQSVRSQAAWSLLCAVLAAVPLLQLVPSGEVFAPRFLYLPLLFLVPFADLALRRAGLARPAILGLAAVALCVGAWQRAAVYADRGSFRRAVLAHAPRDVGSWNDLGLHFEERGEWAAARSAFERATAIDPRYSRAWTNLGRLALADGDLAGAELLLARAVREGPGNPIAHANHGSVLLRLDRAAEAAERYARATELAPGMAAAWRGLANARHRLGDAGGALAALERAFALDPEDSATRALARRIAAE